MKLCTPAFLSFFSFFPLVQMMGLLVPLYMAPNTDWTTLITIKNKYPNLPIIAIINPSSGPGTSSSSTFVTEIAKLKAAKITVLGYIDTIYGARAQSYITQDIDRYHSFYPTIDGIYFDRMQYSAVGYESFYLTVKNYAVTKGFTLNFANAFMRPPISYMATMDVLVISESGGLVNLKTFGTYSPYVSQSAMIVTGLTVMPETWLIQAADVISWVYVTNDVFPTPYDTLSSYLSALAGLLNSINSKVDPTDMIINRNTNIAVGIIISIVSGLLLIGLVLLTVFTFRRRLNEAKTVPIQPNLGDTTVQQWDKSLRTMDETSGNRFKHSGVLTNAAPVPILSVPKKMI